jgi:hypothetical protein
MVRRGFLWDLVSVTNKVFGEFAEHVQAFVEARMKT